VTEGPADLAEWLVAEYGRPVDRWATAALLESRGVRDVDAVERYGCADVFALADLVHPLASSLPEPAGDEPGDPAARWHRRFGRFLTLYVRGTFVALPMAIQIVAMLVLGYALWSYLKFDETQASAVSVGTIASFVVTGGFVQAIGRLGLSYAASGNHLLAEQAVRRLVRWGCIAAAGVGAACWAVNLLTAWFPQWVMAVALVYYALLSVLWLLLAILYTVQHRLGVALSVIVGIVAIWVVRTTTSLDIYVAHWIGLAVSIVLCGAWGFGVLRRRAARTVGEARLAELPRLSILLYSVGPYFAYGVLYFTILFVDRIVAWTTGDFRLPLLVWFRTPYELGLDWALVSLVLAIAVLEYASHAFAHRLIPTQQRTSGLRREEHNEAYVRFYRRQQLLLGAVVVVSIVATYRLVLAAHRFDDVQQARDFFASPVTFQVFALGAVAYGLLAWALLNVSFFFTLSRPWLALRPLVAGLASGVLVGYVLSRVVQDWWAGLGLLVGMATFAVLTARHARRFMRDLDWYYVSA
jgi:hypothetical protein